MCCTVTLSDSSAAPGDSPTKEEMDSVCTFQPQQGQDSAEAPARGTGVQGQSRRMGTFFLYSCPKFCRNSAGRLPHSCPAISPQCETGSGRIKGGQKQAGALPHTRKTGLPLGLNSCSYSASHAFLGNRSWRTPAPFGLFSRLFSLGGELGESVL